MFPKLPIVKYYRAKAASEGSMTVTADLAAAGIQSSVKDAVVRFINNIISLFNFSKQFRLIVSDVN